jgi:hypothetical protein
VSRGIPVVSLDDRFQRARGVADAVVYEGYVLYPYRASARKNQCRWQFGVLAPRPFSEADGSQPWSMRTECVVEASDDTLLDVRLRCLQVQSRVVEAALDGRFEPVPSLTVDGRVWATWDEAVEQQIDVPGIALRALAGATRSVEVRLAEASSVESLTAADGTVVGRIVRTRWPVSGAVHIEATELDGPYPLVRLRVEVHNTTPWAGPAAERDEVVRRSLVAVHTLLAVSGGAFLSQLDPPEFGRPAVAGCTSERTFPVLVGEVGARDVMLSSPIILYDYPEIAPESEGDFCDATEIDEILALRVMTLTDEEKQEARGTDPRAAAIIDRCEDMSEESRARPHGAVRALRPATAATQARLPWWEPGVDDDVDPWTDTIWIGPVEVGKGSRVRLRPTRRADAHDLFLAGRTAVVAGVFLDVDGNRHIAVIPDDDPAADLYGWQGRYLYFHPDEVEPLDGQA